MLGAVRKGQPFVAFDKPGPVWCSIRRIDTGSVARVKRCRSLYNLQLFLLDCYFFRQTTPPLTCGVGALSVRCYCSTGVS